MHEVKIRGNMLIEFRASSRCFQAPKQHSMFKTIIARGFTPMGTPDFPSSSWAAVRCNKNMPPLRHRQVMKSYPRRNNHALLVSLSGNQSRTLPFLTSRELPLRHWQIKRSCPVLHLPRNGASRIKQTGLSVSLKGQHRRGSAPMFISMFKIPLHHTGVPFFSPERAWAATELPEVHLGTPNHE